jgi:hypothetical protein
VELLVVPVLIAYNAQDLRAMSPSIAPSRNETSAPSQNFDRGRTIWIIVTVPVVVLLLIICTIICFLRRRRKLRAKATASNGPVVSMTGQWTKPEIDGNEERPSEIAAGKRKMVIEVSGIQIPAELEGSKVEPSELAGSR